LFLEIYERQAKCIFKTYFILHQKRGKNINFANDLAWWGGCRRRFVAR